MTELLIGVSGIVVAPLFGWGREMLGSSSGQVAWGSGSYYLASAAYVTVAILPFCICMGATFPLVMAGIRAAYPEASPRSFSYLYVANVLGAMLGALGAAFVLIETLGFHKTLLVAAGVNAAVAFASLVISGKLAAPSGEEKRPIPDAAGAAPRTSLLGLTFLFTTGLVSLALEVVWTRQFVPFQGPVVYTFAFTGTGPPAPLRVRARSRGSPMPFSQARPAFSPSSPPTRVFRSHMDLFPGRFALLWASRRSASSSGS
jgi:hypothetical protein